MYCSSFAHPVESANQMVQITSVMVLSAFTEFLPDFFFLRTTMKSPIDDASTEVAACFSSSLFGVNSTSDDFSSSTSGHHSAVPSGISGHSKALVTLAVSWNFTLALPPFLSLVVETSNAFTAVNRLLMCPFPLLKPYRHELAEPSAGLPRRTRYLPA